LDSPFADTVILTKVGFASWVILESTTHLLPALSPARFFLVRFVACNTVMLTLSRLLLRLFVRELRRNGRNVKNLVLVTSREVGNRLKEKIEQRAHFGYRVFRHYSFLPEEKDGGERLISEVRDCLGSTRVDDVILALPAHASILTAQLARECESQGISVRIVPDLFPLIQSDTQVYDLDGIPLINVRLYPTEYIRYAVVKRIFDVLVSIIVLVVLSPVGALIALLIKLSSLGPVFFVQERVGMNGRTFKMLKFRTMRQRLDSDSHWTIPNDPHVTALGRWLRRTNLDELPQFLNVLNGEMSVVGPRPERPFFLERFRREVPEYMARHYVKSGITGWAQVNGWRGDTSIPERVAHDLYYIRNWAMEFDIKIVFLTLMRTFFHRNAY
jgi:Undecaprenyl-phosphate glucose phosphotransferase